MLATMAIMRRRAQVVGGPSDRGQGVSDVFHTPAKVTRADWLRLAGLGLVGHCLYQVLLHRRSRAHQRRQRLPDYRR